MRPRTIVLWIPMLLGYWMTIGVRASFFVPSELPASWTFRSNAPATSRSYWSGSRAAMMAFIIPPNVLLATVLTTALLGWRTAAWHAVFVLLMLVALIDSTLTIDHIPFTRPILLVTQAETHGRVPIRQCSRLRGGGRSNVSRWAAARFASSRARRGESFCLLAGGRGGRPKWSVNRGGIDGRHHDIAGLASHRSLIMRMSAAERRRQSVRARSSLRVATASRLAPRAPRRTAESSAVLDLHQVEALKRPASHRPQSNHCPCASAR